MKNKDEITKIRIELPELPNKFFDDNFDCSLWSETKETPIQFHGMNQELLLKIFYNFNRVAAEKIDDLINFTLKQIGKYNNDDRCCIFLLNKDSSAIRNTHKWCREGIRDGFDNLQELTTDLNPWWMAQLQDHEVIKIPKVEELPPEAEVDKKLMQAQGIKSLLIVPIIFAGSRIGYLGLDSVSIVKDWPENSVRLLNVLAGIFGSALNRKEQISALKESENYYRAIFENTGASTCIIGEDMTVIKVNSECEKVFGHTKGEMEGKKWIDFVDENDKARMIEYHYLRRLDYDKAPQKYNAHFLDNLGKSRDCLITVDLIPGTKNSIVTNVDTTRCSRISRALKATSAINLAQIRSEDEKSLLEDVCKKIVEIGGYRFAWAGYAEDDAERSIIPVAYAGHEEGYLKMLHINCTETASKNEIVAFTMQTGQLFICHDIATDTRFGFWRDEALRRGYKALVAIPLIIAKDNASGVLVIYSENFNVFDEEEVVLLKEMADNIVFGIKSLRNRIERQKAARELEISLEKMQRSLLCNIETLSLQMEARDPYTVAHQKKVACLAGEIAKEMGLPADHIEGIRMAANIHDVGKSTIPTEILCKPGKISEMEFMFIKTHSQAGYDIIKNIEFPLPIADLILQHHERMDGSGYPKGLKGDEITLGARIIAVADVVEAMASQRPYRAPLGIKKALEEIQLQKNKGFDPQVVDACLNLFNKGFVFSQ